MTERTQEKELDALKADIERLREEIAGLAAGIKGSGGSPAGEPPSAEGEAGADEESHALWGGLLHKLNASRVQGEKVVRDLAAEVEQHPLVSIVAAFGLGYIIAKLWYRGTNNGDALNAS
ncbi:MAG: hypothetical protein ACYC7L_13255 [Nitrospirota bacterium]